MLGIESSSPSTLRKRLLKVDKYLADLLFEWKIDEEFVQCATEEELMEFVEEIVEEERKAKRNRNVEREGKTKDPDNTTRKREILETLRSLRSKEEKDEVNECAISLAAASPSIAFTNVPSTPSSSGASVKLLHSLTALEVAEFLRSDEKDVNISRDLQEAEIDGAVLADLTGEELMDLITEIQSEKRPEDERRRIVERIRRASVDGVPLSDLESSALSVSSSIIGGESGSGVASERGGGSRENIGGVGDGDSGGGGGGARTNNGGGSTAMTPEHPTRRRRKSSILWESGSSDDDPTSSSTSSDDERATNDAQFDEDKGPRGSSAVRANPSLLRGTRGRSELVQDGNDDDGSRARAVDDKYCGEEEEGGCHVEQRTATCSSSSDVCGAARNSLNALRDVAKKVRKALDNCKMDDPKEERNAHKQSNSNSAEAKLFEALLGTVTTKMEALMKHTSRLASENQRLEREVKRVDMIQQTLVQNRHRKWIFRDPEDRIGEGAFAEVFRVHLLSSSTDSSSANVPSSLSSPSRKCPEYFALKRIKKAAYEAKSVEIEALQREVMIQKELSHPNIVTLVETYMDAPPEEDGGRSGDQEEGEEDDDRRNVLHIVMEFADFGSLQDKIREGSRLSNECVWDYVVQMFSAIHYLHRERVIHRDIKPLNVFLAGPGGRIVKIGDFGISVQLPADNPDAKVYEAVGTPYYLSPELCEGRAYDSRSDVWALGCTIYELVTLKKAYSAASIAGLVHAICKGTPPTLIADVADEGVEKEVKDGTESTTARRTQRKDENAAPVFVDRALSTMIGRMLTKDFRNRPTLEELRVTFSDTIQRRSDAWEKRRVVFEARRREAMRRGSHGSDKKGFCGDDEGNLSPVGADGAVEKPTLRNRAYNEENLKEIIANYHQEEMLRRQIGRNSNINSSSKVNGSDGGGGFGRGPDGSSDDDEENITTRPHRFRHHHHHRNRSRRRRQHHPDTEGSDATASENVSRATAPATSLGTAATHSTVSVAASTPLEHTCESNVAVGATQKRATKSRSDEVTKSTDLIADSKRTALMSKRSWYGLRRLHRFGRGAAQPRWICSVLLARLLRVRSSPGGQLTCLTTDHGLIVPAGKVDRDDVPSGLFTGHWSWLNPPPSNVGDRRLPYGARVSFARGIVRETRLRSAPPLPFFGRPNDLEQVRLDEQVLNFDPTTRRTSSTAAYGQYMRRNGHGDDSGGGSSSSSDGGSSLSSNSSDAYVGLDLAMALKDKWICHMWTLQRIMLETETARYRALCGMCKTKTTAPLRHEDESNVERARRRVGFRVVGLSAALGNRKRSLEFQQRRAELLLRHRKAAAAKIDKSSSSALSHGLLQLPQILSEDDMKSVREEIDAIGEALETAQDIVRSITNAHEKGGVQSSSTTNREDEAFLRVLTVAIGSNAVVCRTSGGGLYVWGRLSEMLTAGDLRDGLKLTPVVGGVAVDDVARMCRVGVGREKTPRSAEDESDEDDEDCSGLNVVVDEDDQFCGLSVPHRVHYFEQRSIPIAAVSIGGALEGGDDAFVFFITQTRGDVYVFGSHVEGALGLGIRDGDVVDVARHPTKVPGLPPIREVTCGSAHALALSREGGHLWAWGDNSEGQLGLGRRPDASLRGGEVGKKDGEDVETSVVSSPRLLEHFRRLCGACRSLVELSEEDVRFEQIATGTTHNAAISREGDLYVFGQGRGGRLGLGTDFWCERKQRRQQWEGASDDDDSTMPTVCDVPTRVRVPANPDHDCIHCIRELRRRIRRGAEEKTNNGDRSSKKKELHHRVKRVSCGTEHTVALVSCGASPSGPMSVFTWGRGAVSQGRSTCLGHVDGGDDDDESRTSKIEVKTPKRVAYFDGQYPIDVFAAGGRCECVLDEAEETAAFAGNDDDDDLYADGTLDVADDADAQCFVLCRPPLMI
eukprot:g2848.t1